MPILLPRPIEQTWMPSTWSLRLERPKRRSQIGLMHWSTEQDWSWNVRSARSSRTVKLKRSVFDPDLEDLFADLTKIETFKWERDVAAHRQGREMTIERRSIDGAPLNQDDPDMSNAHPFMDDQPNDVFVDHNADVCRSCPILIPG